MENLVRLNDKTFRLFKSESEILSTIRSLAQRINDDYIGKRPLLVPVLNGSFMFAADLLRELKLDCEVSFIKASSYQGVQSSGSVTTHFGFDRNMEGRHIIILEDIIDSGLTLHQLLPSFKEQNPASLKVAALLWKPLSIQTGLIPDYTGIEIPGDFVVGYGLDYQGLGRNLRAIYQVISDSET